MQKQDKRIPKIIAAACFALVLFSTGCMSAPAGLSPSSEPLMPGSYVEIGPAKGQFNSVLLLGAIPLSETGAPGQRALQRALESSEADALVKISVDAKTYNCGVAVLLQTEVTGTAVRKIDN